VLKRGGRLLAGFESGEVRPDYEGSFSGVYPCEGVWGVRVCGGLGVGFCRDRQDVAAFCVPNLM